MTDQHLNLPPWDGRSRPVAFVWRLAKGRHYATCKLWTHPIGAELRITTAREFVRSEAGQDALVLIELAERWRQRWEEKGWKERAASRNFEVRSANRRRA